MQLTSNDVYGRDWDPTQIGVDVTGYGDAQVKTSLVENQPQRELVEMVDIDVFFNITRAGTTPASLTDVDWEYLIYDAAQMALFPEEPRYGQMIYDSATSTDQSDPKPAPYGGDDFVSTISFRATKGR